jgi:hypothetical protein
LVLVLAVFSEATAGTRHERRVNGFIPAAVMIGGDLAAAEQPPLPNANPDAQEA